MKKGDLVATLETVRYENEVRAARAKVKSVETQVKTAKNNMERNAQWFIVPGVIVIIMSVIGCCLTSTQVAKEYEFGTLESIFATPVTPFEVLVSKLLSNYVLGILGLLLSVALSRFCFGVQLRGSFGWLFLGSTMFLATPIACMPLPLQYFARVNPVAYANVALHRIFLEGAGLVDVLPSAFAMFAIGFVCFAFAWLRFRKN